MKNESFIELLTALEEALLNTVKSIGEEAVTAGNFHNWVAVAALLRSQELEELTLENAPFLPLLEAALAAAKDPKEYGCIHDLCRMYGRRSQKALSIVAIDKSVKVLKRVMKEVEWLLANRPNITRLSDMIITEGVCGELGLLDYGDCCITAGLCAYMKTALIDSPVEDGAWYESYKLFCTQKGVEHHYPVAAGEHKGTDLARAEYSAASAKWGSDEYGQARWKFVEEYREFLSSLISAAERRQVK